MDLGDFVDAELRLGLAAVLMPVLVLVLVLERATSGERPCVSPRKRVGTGPAL